MRRLNVPRKLLDGIRNAEIRELFAQDALTQARKSGRAHPRAQTVPKLTKKEDVASPLGAPFWHI